jgi:hypothetical protein
MLRRRLFAVALPLVLAAAWSPAAAAEEGARKQVGQYVDIQPVGVPVVLDGRLQNYIFVYVRLNLVAGADTSRWRAKEPYFRDALVRLAHETAFTLPNDRDKVDAAKLTAAFGQKVATITGPGVIRSVVVTSQIASRSRP